MTELLFVWTVDVDGDGTAEVERYRSTLWVPNVEPPDGGRAVRTKRVETLDGGARVLATARADRADQRAPGSLTLSWEVADPDFLRIAEEDYARGRLVSVRLDHRWRRLQVTSSGRPDRTALVAPGYWLTGGDTCWPLATTPLAHVCAATSTQLYAVSTEPGLFTLGDTADALPVGAASLAEIAVVDDVLLVTAAETGVANARTGRMTAFTPTQLPGGLTGLSLTLQEVEP